MLRDTESSTALWTSLQEAVVQVLQLIDLRLALLIGVATFMVAVGFDSSGHPAAAADFVTQAALVPVRVAAMADTGDSALPVAQSFDEAQRRMAQRLHHGSLTGAILTSNRMTDAHFFTDFPPAE